MTEIDIRTQILDATEARFSQYGYNKTTMAEIARDCGMSAANLYRYFKNKLDIGAALAQQCLAEKESVLVEIVNDDKLASSERLEAFIMHVLHHTYHHFNDAPKLSELVDAMAVQCPSVVDAHRQSKLVLLEQLLQSAIDKGEFSVLDIPATADAIHTAISVFALPTVMPMYSLEQLEKKAKDLSALLLTGLQTR